MNIWNSVFDRAKEVARNAEIEVGTIGSNSEYDFGGFHQPKELGHFLNETLNHQPTIITIPNQTQICRVWLKSTFLESSTKCHGSCQRLHSIEHILGNPKKLYQDFSFKGLGSKKQKIIFQKITDIQKSVYDSTQFQGSQCSRLTEKITEINDEIQSMGLATKFKLECNQTLFPRQKSIKPLWKPYSQYQGSLIK